MLVTRPLALTVTAALIAVTCVTVSACGGSVQCRYGDLAGCQKACGAEDATSCTRLGAMHESGASPGDADTPLRYYLRACLLGDGVGCHMAGLKHVLGPAGDLQSARRAFDAACVLKYGNGCAMSGALLASERPPRTAEANARYERACTLGSALGCQFMKEATGAPPPSSPSTTLAAGN
jgi:TPR repeat protein